MLLQKKVRDFYGIFLCIKSVVQEYDTNALGLAFQLTGVSFPTQNKFVEHSLDFS